MSQKKKRLRFLRVPKNLSMRKPMGRLLVVSKEKLLEITTT